MQIFNNLKSQCPVSNKKITRQANKQENMTHNQEKYQSIETDPELKRWWNLQTRALQQLL